MTARITTAELLKMIRGWKPFPLHCVNGIYAATDSDGNVTPDAYELDLEELGGKEAE